MEKLIKVKEKQETRETSQKRELFPLILQLFDFHNQHFSHPYCVFILSVLLLLSNIGFFLFFSTIALFNNVRSFIILARKAM